MPAIVQASCGTCTYTITQSASDDITSSDRMMGTHQHSLQLVVDLSLCELLYFVDLGLEGGVRGEGLRRLGLGFLLRAKELKGESEKRDRMRNVRERLYEVLSSVDTTGHVILNEEVTVGSFPGLCPSFCHLQYKKA